MRQASCICVLFIANNLTIEKSVPLLPNTSTYDSLLSTLSHILTVQSSTLSSLLSLHIISDINLNFLLPRALLLSDAAAHLRTLIADLPVAVSLFKSNAEEAAGLARANELVIFATSPMPQDGRVGGEPQRDSALLRTPAEFASCLRALEWQLWSEEWRSRISSTLKSFFPELTDLIAATRKTSFRYVKRLVTGHCALNASRHRFNLASSPSCSCGDPSETVEHFLFFCPRFAAARSPLVHSSREYTGIWPPKLEDLWRFAALWTEFTSFAATSGRFSKSSSEAE